MKPLHAALASTLAFLVILPVHAQTVNSSPFGAAVFGRWMEGGRLQEQGDFNSAQIQYQRALAAAQQLSNPTLRDCATSGTQARIAAMEAARAYIRANGDSFEAIAQAQRIADAQFRQTINQFDQERPDLVGRCP
ncbi:hypothetical protein [Leptolyngbya ohadii]|uniref:hypothetical protein n=1 Tax=Leptolyngbya ohadii TaxID=1962290 RepID=UPI000B59896E|nr:hypothetical protein [Leptolyngbya ohadii]